MTTDLILVADAAYPPAVSSLPPDTAVMAGYVGGNTPHVWTAAERQVFIDHGMQWWGIWTMPERALTQADADYAARGQIAAYRAMGYPTDHPALLDVEHSAYAADVAACMAAVGSWKAQLKAAGWHTAIAYLPWAAQTDWVANWTNVRPASLPPGVLGWQYGGNTTGGYDLSVFDSTVGGPMALDPNDPVIVALNDKIDHNFGLLLYGDSKDAAYGNATQTHPFNLYQIKGELDALTKAIAGMTSGNVDPVALAQAIAAHIAVNLTTR